jgi:aspartate/methionine/tyrosine aminotransferase
MMRFEPLGLEEWFYKWRGVGTNLDVSGAPAPFEEFHPEFDEESDLVELEEELVELLAQIYGVGTERITLTCGTQNANSLVLITQLNEEDIVAAEHPIYEPLQKVAEQVCRLKDLPRTLEDQYRPDMNRLTEILDSGSRLVMLTNIHNPSGAALCDDEMRAILETAGEREALVLCDEIYREMCYSEPPKSAFEIGDNAIVTNGVTKLYGLGDLRVGWVIGPEDVARDVELCRLAISSHLPAYSVAVAIQALKKRQWFRNRMLSRARENLKVLNEWARAETRVSFMMPEGGLMFLLPLPKGMDDLEFSEFLLENHDTAVCPGRYFGVRGQIRITFSCPPEEFTRGLRNVSAALDHFS